MIEYKHGNKTGTNCATNLSSKSSEIRARHFRAPRTAPKRKEKLFICNDIRKGRYESANCAKHPKQIWDANSYENLTVREEKINNLHSYWPDQWSASRAMEVSWANPLASHSEQWMLWPCQLQCRSFHEGHPKLRAEDYELLPDIVTRAM